MAKRAFTIVELIIVVSIIGILAALAVPLVGDYITDAKESAAKTDLRIVRNMIETYAAKNNNAPPGYLSNDTSASPTLAVFLLQVKTSKLISNVPQNPFNGKKFIKFIDNLTNMPAEATGENGWIYKPSNRQFRLDWPGRDKKGVRYYDY